MAAALKHVDKGTRVVAIFAHHGKRLVAVAAMRSVRGSSETPVLKSVGDSHSSVPTHRLLVPCNNLPVLHEILMRDRTFKSQAHVTRGYLTGVLNECQETRPSNHEPLNLIA